MPAQVHKLTHTHCTHALARTNIHTHTQDHHMRQEVEGDDGATKGATKSALPYNESSPGSELEQCSLWPFSGRGGRANASNPFQ